MQNTEYQPPQEILKKYADLLVKFALNSGEGIKPNEVAIISGDDVSKPLLMEVYRSVLEAGGYPMMEMKASGVDKVLYSTASDDQLEFFAEDFMKAKVNMQDQYIKIFTEHDPHELSAFDSARIFRHQDAQKQYREWLFEKEGLGKHTWTAALWGTAAMAKEASVTLEEYWQIIIEACYLDYEDPVAEWRKIMSEQEKIKKTLSDMEIEWVNVKGENIDLNVQIGANRKWNAGSGRNIPSYEVFTSPDWRGTNGHIKFNQPLYRYGNLIENIRLEFKDGLVVKAEATKGQKVLDNMLKRENADKLGEFSLTDKRVSRITQFTANSLLDENVGGEFGNTHVAIGMAYKDCYKGKESEVTKEQWLQMGYNDSPEHTDIMSTEDRTVTATLQDGSKKVIYKNGMFTV